MYSYQLEGVYDSNPLKQTLGYGQIEYSNNLLQYCSVQQISMLQYSYQVSPDITYPVPSNE